MRRTADSTIRLTRRGGLSPVQVLLDFSLRITIALAGDDSYTESSLFTRLLLSVKYTLKD